MQKVLVQPFYLVSLGKSAGGKLINDIKNYYANKL